MSIRHANGDVIAKGKQTGQMSDPDIQTAWSEWTANYAKARDDTERTTIRKGMATYLHNLLEMELRREFFGGMEHPTSNDLKRWAVFQDGLRQQNGIVTGSWPLAALMRHLNYKNPPVLFRPRDLDVFYIRERGGKRLKMTKFDEAFRITKRVDLPLDDASSYARGLTGRYALSAIREYALLAPVSESVPEATTSLASRLKEPALQSQHNTNRTSVLQVIELTPSLRAPENIAKRTKRGDAKQIVVDAKPNINEIHVRIVAEFDVNVCGFAYHPDVHFEFNDELLSCLIHRQFVFRRVQRPNAERLVKYVARGFEVRFESPTDCHKPSGKYRNACTIKLFPPLSEQAPNDEKTKSIEYGIERIFTNDWDAMYNFGQLESNLFDVFNDRSLVLQRATNELVFNTLEQAWTLYFMLFPSPSRLDHDRIATKNPTAPTAMKRALQNCVRSLAAYRLRAKEETRTIKVFLEMCDKSPSACASFHAYAKLEHHHFKFVYGSGDIKSTETLTRTCWDVVIALRDFPTFDVAAGSGQT